MTERCRHRRLDDLAESYCEKLEEMQQRCEQHGLNFRLEMMRLVEDWLEARKAEGAGMPTESRDQQ